MSYRIFVDSSTYVEFDPEYSFRDGSRKIEKVHRTPAGKELRYRTGDYVSFDVPVKYVNSSFTAIVNSWWFSNTDLLFMKVGETQVYSVHITNIRKPLNKFVRPYDNLWEGTIELESY